MHPVRSVEYSFIFPYFTTLCIPKYISFGLLQKIMDWFTLIILVILTSILIFYLYVKWSFTYWKRRGAEYIAPEFPFGNTKSFMKKELSLGDQFTIFYKEFKSRGVVGGGVYVSFNPMFVVVDLELAKNIVQTDFNHFVNHGIYVNEEDDPLSGNLFALEDERWKYLRTKLTPTFTSGNKTSYSYFSQTL